MIEWGGASIVPVGSGPMLVPYKISPFLLAPQFIGGLGVSLHDHQQYDFS
jgi:hypothetical protein